MKSCKNTHFEVTGYFLLLFISKELEGLFEYKHAGGMNYTCLWCFPAPALVSNRGGIPWRII